MSVTVASFRTSLPEFSEQTVYPDATVEFWIGLAGRLLRSAAWLDLLDDGIMLFVAHNLVLAGSAARAATSGSAPGTASGAVSSKTVDKVSVSYDTAGAMTEGGGQFNLTTYGQRYLQLERVVGMGGSQI